MRHGWRHPLCGTPGAEAASWSQAAYKRIIGSRRSFRCRWCPAQLRLECLDRGTWRPTVTRPKQTGARRLESRGMHGEKIDGHSGEKPRCEDGPRATYRIVVVCQTRRGGVPSTILRTRRCASATQFAAQVEIDLAAVPFRGSSSLPWDKRRFHPRQTTSSHSHRSASVTACYSSRINIIN